MKESSAGKKLTIIRYALFIIRFLRLPLTALFCQYHLAQDVDTLSFHFTRMACTSGHYYQSAAIS